MTIKLTSTGWKGMVAAGVTSGFSYDLIEQMGANVIHLASGGQDGHAGIDLSKLALSTGGGGAAAGAMAGVGAAFRWLLSKIMVKASNEAGGTAGSIVNEMVLDIKGATRLTAWGKSIVTPRAKSMNLAEAGDWFRESVAKIPDLVSKAPNAQAGVVRAHQLLLELRAGAKAATYDAESAAILEARYPIPTLESMINKLANGDSKLSGDALYKEVISEIGKMKLPRYPKNVDGCFVAGTLVHTDQGLVPIEKIKVGDRVLSQPEQGGETAYKRVVRTLTFEDKEVWVVKFGFCDGHPDDHIIHHLYATGNHPFWVEGKGWTAAQKLQNCDHIRLSSGEQAWVHHVWPVVRTPVKELGWVTTDTQGWVFSGEDPYYCLSEQGGHIVDFRCGCNLWKYAAASNLAFLEERSQLALQKYNIKGVPYFDGFGFDESEAPFHCREMETIIVSHDPSFKTRVYNLEVEDFHTYYVGELGVWVHNDNCEKLAELNPGYGTKVPGTTPRYELGSNLTGDIKKGVYGNPELPSGFAVLRSQTTTHIKNLIDLGFDRNSARTLWMRIEDKVRGRLIEPTGTMVKDFLLRARFEPVLIFKNSQPGEKYIRADGHAIINGVKTLIDIKMGLRAKMKGIDSRKSYIENDLRRVTEALEQNPDYNWLVEIWRWEGSKYAAPDMKTLSLDEVNALLDAMRRVVDKKAISGDEYLQKVDKGLMERILNKVKDGRLRFEDGPPGVVGELRQQTPKLGSAMLTLLTLADTVPLIDAARSYWQAAGALPQVLDRVTVGIADLPDGSVGTTEGSRITLDATAAGWGWYLDPDPSGSSEFATASSPSEFIAVPGSPAAGKLDLLTVLIHEFGHVLGLGHAESADDEMTETIEPGVRRLPQVSASEQTALGFGTIVTSPLRSGRSITSSLSAFAISANPTLTNPAFTGNTGWSTTGPIAFANNAATLTESATAQTRLNQVFVVGPNDRFLSFTLANIGLDDPSTSSGQVKATAPDDAFEVALLDANTGASLLAGTGLTKSDAILNLQANGAERKASGLTSVLNPDGSRTYLVDLSGIAADTVVTLLELIEDWKDYNFVAATHGGYRVCKRKTMKPLMGFSAGDRSFRL